MHLKIRLQNFRSLRGFRSIEPGVSPNIFPFDLEKIKTPTGERA